MFKIVGTTTSHANTYTPTRHIINERMARYELVKSLGGTPLKSWVVDKGHENGLEVHTVTSQGTIYIGNLRTQKLVTFLIARPEQLQRYGVKDSTVLEIARQHQLKGYNNM